MPNLALKKLDDFDLLFVTSEHDHLKGNYHNRIEKFQMLIQPVRIINPFHPTGQFSAHNMNQLY